ncbi:hypothetical protein [Pontibaca salina]|uniref:Uncharacterized protein n=1 Tax=Pontibaca salina TaxID=2795731 RepID=A0A934HMK7_9RHOB|nr:hypothetical protein [Pontibaca salina]MBI6628352.1 hypothetical protein [Pontibaca salina]
MSSHQNTETARFVATHPEHYIDRPHLYSAAWRILKEARGQGVDPRHIGASRHCVVTADPVLERIRPRIHARAVELGITGPAPLIFGGTLA